MKLIPIFLALMVLLISTVSASEIGIINGKIQGEDAYHPSFWRTFLQPQSLSFVGINAENVDMVCTKTMASEELSHISGSASSTGWMCKNGQYIAFRAYENTSDNVIVKDQYLFDNLWYKSNDEDLLQWSNYYLRDRNFNFYYECYTCVNATTRDTEPGCLNLERTDCIAKDEPGCDVWYGYESVCMERLNTLKPETKEKHWYDFFTNDFTFNTSLQLISVILALLGSGWLIHSKTKKKK